MMNLFCPQCGFTLPPGVAAKPFCPECGKPLHLDDGVPAAGAKKHRWDLSEREEAFIEEIVELCKRYGLWLSHEDGHGAFMVTGAYDTEGWLRAAHHDYRFDKE